MGAQSRGGAVRQAAKRHKQKGINLQNEINFQQGNIDTYWNFKAYAEGTKAPKVTGQHTKRLQTRGKRKGLTQAQRDAGYGTTYDVYTFYSPADKAKKAGYSPTKKQEGSFYMWKYFDYNNQRWKHGDKKTYKNIAASHKGAALEASLGKLDQAHTARKLWELKPFNSSTVKSPIRDGSRGVAVLKDNQIMNKVIGGKTYTQKERGINALSDGMVMPNTSDGSTGFIQHYIENPRDVLGGDSLVSQIGAGDPNAIGSEKHVPTGDVIHNTGAFDNYANIIPNKPKDKDIFIDEGRHDYLMGVLSDGNDSRINKQNISNLYGFDDKLTANYEGMTDDQKKMHDRKHNAKLIKQLNAEKDASGADIKYLSTAIKKLSVKGISPSASAKIKDGLTKKYPNILLSGSHVNDIATIEKVRLDEMTRNVELKKNQDDMNMYIAKERVNTIERRQGDVVTMKNTADIRASSLKTKEQDTAISVSNSKIRRMNKMWDAIMTDPNIVKVGNKYVRVDTKNIGTKSLEEKVNIIKSYDSWGDRRTHIGSELDTRKENLFTMYNNKYDFDTSVSDKEASQHLLGRDAPEGHSLTITAFAETDIDNKTPRKLIKSLNTVIDKTNKDREVYTKGISEVDAELLSLKEKRILQKEKNKTIRDSLRQQIETDVSEGNIGPNTSIQDKIQLSQDDLARLNLGIAERNVKKDYWEKSIAKTDDDLSNIDVTMKKAIKAKRQKDFNALTAVYSTGLPSKTRGPLYGYYNRRSTGIQKKRTRSGYTAGLGGLVL